MTPPPAEPVRVPATGSLPVDQVAPPRPGTRRLRRAAALLEAARPRQWLKNVLLLAAPAAAGVLFRPAVLGRTAAAFCLLVAASAATYLVNDVVDRERDRQHPVKCRRPVASGRLQPPLALAAAAVLAGVALLGAAGVGGARLAATVGAYLVVSVAYSLWLKGIPLVELACVASGFTLRAVAGGAAAHVPVSPWFLVMTSFGALLVVAGKRTAEQQALGAAQTAHRTCLAAYPPEFLRGVRALAMSVTVTTYCLWVFARAALLERSDHGEDLIWFQLSIIPFVLAVLALELAIRGGRAGAPEDLALSDRMLQVLGAAWAVLLLCGVYA